MERLRRNAIALPVTESTATLTERYQLETSKPVLAYSRLSPTQHRATTLPGQKAIPNLDRHLQALA